MYLRLAIKGSLPGGEVWSVNPAFHFNAVLSPAWDQESANAIVTALVNGLQLNTIPTPLLNLMSGSATITSYRLEGRDEDESLLGVAEAAYATPQGGTGTTMTKTAQSAVVGSLRTNTPGSRGRGRVYWPALGAAISTTTGRLTTPTAQASADAFAGLFTLCQNIIRDNAGLFPWTTVLLGVRSTTDHVTRTVTRIEVGDVIDTQRRRRDTMPENYSSATYPDV